MTDKISSDLKTVQVQFRAARIVICCAAAFISNKSNAPVQPLYPASSAITAPVPATVTPSYIVIPPAPVDPNSQKSSAQVASLVRPPVVSPNSCELKLGRLRPYRLMGRFSKDEKETVEDKAEQAALSVNEYIRAVTLGPDSYKPPHDPAWTQALLAANRELTRQGNNLNQIARQRNANLIDEAQTDSLLGLLARTYLQTHRAVRTALSRGQELPPEP